MRSRRTLALTAVVVFAASVIVPASLAKPGRIDHSYGGNAFGIGSVGATSWPTLIDYFAGMAQTRGGKLVLAGATDTGAGGDDFILARLLRNGKLDKSFGDPVKHVTSGNISGNDDVTGTAVGRDGSIFVIAESAGGLINVFGVAKVDRNGVFDPAFNGTGRVTTAVGTGDAFPLGVAIQKDGRIVVVGDAVVGTTEQFGIVRYRPNGTPDPDFGGGDGIVTTDFGLGNTAATDVAIQKDGKIVVSGTATVSPGRFVGVLARYRPNGTLDSGFGKGGKVRLGGVKFGSVFALAVEPNRRILVAGGIGPTQEGGPVLARLRPAGKLDRTFGARGTGRVTVDLDLEVGGATDIAVQRNGKVIVSGYAGDDGFSGHFGNFVARLTPRGRIDRAFGFGGSRLFFLGSRRNPSGELALQSDGRILVGAGLETGSIVLDITVRRFLGDPPQTRLGKAGLGGSKASFSFSAVPAAGAKFACALRRAGSGKPHFSKCKSPRKFNGLRPGPYTFTVRARSVNGPDPTPARRSFAVR